MRGIYGYIATTSSLSNAQKVLAAFEKSFISLSDMPKRNPVILKDNSFDLEVRSAFVYRWKIFYTVKNKSVI